MRQQSQEYSWPDLIVGLQQMGPTALRAKVDKSHYLTMGKDYVVSLQNGIPFFNDDLEIPTELTAVKYNEQFHSVFFPHNASVDEARIATATRYKTQVAELLEGLKKHKIPEGGFKPGDVVMDFALHEAFQIPMIVMRVLTRDEQLKAAQFAQTISARRILVFYRHEDGGYGAGIYSAEALTKVGSLEEWGLPALDPKLISQYTIFE